MATEQGVDIHANLGRALAVLCYASSQARKALAVVCCGVMTEITASNARASSLPPGYSVRHILLSIPKLVCTLTLESIFPFDSFMDLAVLR